MENQEASRSVVPNAREVEFWNSAGGSRWVSLQKQTDSAFHPVMIAALDHAGPQTSTVGLDIGCGCGATTLELSRRVGPFGRILGVDVSKMMLAVARERALEAGCSNVEFVAADASTYQFEPLTFDFAFSRLGVMFFDNPVAAFAHIRKSLKSGARITFVCLREITDNPYLLVPMVAAKPHLPAQDMPNPEAPGALAFANADRVKRILSESGFRYPALMRHDTMIKLGEPGELDQAAAFAAQIGPVSRGIAIAEPNAKAAAETAIREKIAQLATKDGFFLPGSFWLASAYA